MDHAQDVLDERAVALLRWRCRRGLLENDLFLERFFARHGDRITAPQAEALSQLMELGDHDLMDLHLARKTLAELDPSLDTVQTREVLNLLRENR